MCCCNVRIGTRVACIFDLTYKVAGAIAFMKGGSAAIIMAMVPTFLLLVSTFTNDVSLA